MCDTPYFGRDPQTNNNAVLSERAMNLLLAFRSGSFASFAFGSGAARSQRPLPTRLLVAVGWCREENQGAEEGKDLSGRRPKSRRASRQQPSRQNAWTGSPA